MKRFKKNVEVEEVKQTLTGREKAEIRAKIKENEKKIEQLKREKRETEKKLKAKIKQATSQAEQNRKAREKEQKLFDLIEKKINNKLSAKKDLTAEQIKTLFWYLLHNISIQNKYVEVLTQALENLAYERIPEIQSNFETAQRRFTRIDNDLKTAETNFNILNNKVSNIEKIVFNRVFKRTA